MMRRYGQFLLLVMLTACAVGQRADNSRLATATVHPLARVQDGYVPPDATTIHSLPIVPGRAWTGYVFDVKADSAAGRSVTLGSDFRHATLAPNRLLIAAGSMGTGGPAGHQRHELQTNIGLWPDARVGRVRARIYVNASWPMDDGQNAETLDGMTIQARLVCEDWAVAMALPQNQERGRALRAAFDHDDDRLLPVQLTDQPARIDEYRVIPIKVTLRGQGFTANCIDAAPVEDQ